MTNLPGEDRAVPPTLSSETSEVQLRLRSAEIIARLGQLGLEVAALTDELTTINERLAKPPEDIAAIEESDREDAPVELFSAGGRQAARPQEELEDLAAKNDAFPDKLQDIFTSSRRLFESELFIREQSSDPRVGIIRFNRSEAPPAMPVYDSQNPSNWEKFVDKHAQRIEWDSRDETRRCSFSIRYVRLADGRVEMVGYGYEHKPRSAQLFIDHDNTEQAMRASKVSVECANGHVRKASMSTISQNRSRYEDVNVEEATYRYSSDMSGKTTLTYNPEEYRFEDKRHGGEDADGVLAKIALQMSFLPTVEQPGPKQEI